MPNATLNYLARMDEKPVYYLVPPPPGTPWRNTRGDRRDLPIQDARALDPQPSLDTLGFQLAPLQTAAEDLYDAEEVHRVYYREVESLVKRVTGASRVFAFDHNVRSSEFAGRGERGAQNPVWFPHNDYTEDSSPQRVRDLLPAEEAEALLQHRFAVVNVWKPIRGPVQKDPLAICDARTIQPTHFVPTDLRYQDRIGEIYSLTFSEEHRWFYYPTMQVEEALLLKCFDSARDRARLTAHTAFEDDSSAPDAPDRESIEVRTLAFFAANT
ncbi:methyltransferase [Myxococcota bacterium]|nr:methyltransferase [Myxococcota bacterium]